MTSPFASAYPELAKLGYSCIPIMARAKAPGDYRGKAWKPAHGWPKYRDRAPTPFETGIWCRNWPDANVGVVLGTRVGDRQLVAVDFDVTDPDTLDELARTIPVSPMRKKGAKGFTAFYLAPLSTKSQQFSVGPMGKIDILTGNETRQTVMPPSVHPDGPVYAWLNGPCAIADLPHIETSDLEQLLDTASRYVPDAPAPRLREERAPVEADTPFAELNALALRDMSWVPALDLPKTQPKSNGYHAVASFRPSSTGRPVSQRKQNLSITSQGIKDFGTGATYSALDLVMAALGKDFDAAFAWLSDRLMPAVRAPVVPNQHLLVPEPVAVPQPASPSPDLSVPGLVGEMAQWITESAIKPQPKLSLLAALSVVGTIINRRIATPYRDGQTTLYAVGLSPTGGNKEHPLKATAILLKAGGFPEMTGPGDFSAASAIVRRLQRNPIALCPMDEFGAFCGMMLSNKAGPFQRAMSKVFRELWGTNFGPFFTSEYAQIASDVITAPGLSIFGVSTTKEFWKHLTGADISNGLLNRFLLIENTTRPHMQEPKHSRLRPPDSIIDGMKRLCSPLEHVASVAKEVNPRALSWGPGAEDAFLTFARAVQDRGDHNPDEEDYLQRTAEMALRVATIVAAGRFSSVVTVEDFAIGRALALESAETMIDGARRHIAETEHQSNMKMVVNIIKDAGTITRKALYRKIDGKLDKRALDSVIALATAGEQIEEIKVKNPNPAGGPPVTTYRLVRD